MTKKANWEKEFDKKFPYGGMIIEDDGSRYTFDDIKAFISSLLSHQMKRDFTDSDVVYMCETILGYLDMGMVDRAKEHLENLQRWFVDLSPEGKLSAPREKEAK